MQRRKHNQGFEILCWSVCLSLLAYLNERVSQHALHIFLSTSSLHHTFLAVAVQAVNAQTWSKNLWLTVTWAIHVKVSFVFPIQGGGDFQEYAAKKTHPGLWNPLLVSLPFLASLLEWKDITACASHFFFQLLLFTTLSSRMPCEQLMRRREARTRDLPWLGPSM